MLKSLFGILWGRILFVLVLFPVIIYAIIQTHSLAVGPLKNVLWKELDGITHVVEELGYNIPTPVPIVLNFNREITKDDLIFLQEYANYLKIKLPRNWTVTSLANYNVRAWDGEYEIWTPYISPTLHTEENFSMDSWKTRAQENKAVYGSFVDKNFQYLVLLIGYPAVADELSTIRTLRRVLQRRYPPKGSLWETMYYYVTDYTDTDFVPYTEPHWPDILVGSSAVTRTLITWALFVDVDIKSIIGYAFALPFLIIVFGRVEQAFAIWTGTLFAFLATIASIWPLSLVGIHYSVFLLPPLIGGVLIASISFNTQIMEEVKHRGSVVTHEEWKSIAISVRRAINYIFCMAIVCFCIFGIAFQSLWIAIAMDAVLIIGSLWAWGVQRWLLPALYFFFAERKWRTPSFLASASRWFEEKHTRGMERKIHVINKRISHSTTYYIKVLLLFPVILAGALAFFGHINTNSQPIEFLGDSYGKTMLQKIAKLGRLDVIPIMFEGIGFDNDPLTHEEFYAAAKKFIRDLAMINSIGNIFTSIEQITYEMERKDSLVVPFHEAVTLTREGVQQIGMTPWTEWGGGVLIYADHPSDDARSLDQSIHEINSLQKKYQAMFAWLTISLFGEILHYPEIANVITTQVPWMLLTSLLAVFLYYSWMVHTECEHIPALAGGYVISQAFLFVSGVVVVVMGIFTIPLDIPTAAIIPIVINAASDAVIYPAQEFFYLLKNNRNECAKVLSARALRTRGKAVDIDCISNMLILSLLMLSSFSPVRNLGLLACLSLFACRWWSINFTLPQLARLQITHNRTMEVPHENNIMCTAVNLSPRPRSYQC